MKNTLITIGILFSFISCKQEETNPLDTTNIFGTWQMIETSIGIPQLGGGGINELSNGYRVVFSQNGTFNAICSQNGDVFHEGYIVGVCKNSKGSQTTGVFSFSSEDSIMLVFNELIEGFATDEFAKNRTYKYHFEDNYLIMENLLCDEGCYDVFKKIADEEVTIGE